MDLQRAGRGIAAVAMVRSRRGSALLLTLVLVGLLSLAVVEFIREARYETLSASNAVAAVEALALTRSGTAAGEAILKYDLQQSNIDDRTEFWYTGEGEDAFQAVPVGENTVNLRIEDLYGKFPIASLVDQAKAPLARDAYIRLLDALELEGVDSQDLADALVDWMDDDTQGRYEYNRDFSVPDAVPEHLDELSRIEVYKDLPRETLARIRSQLDTRVEDNGDYTVNANTASVPVLMAACNLPRDAAENYYDNAGNTPFPTPQTAANGAGVPPSSIFPKFIVKSTRFALTVKADVREIVKEARCVVTRNPGQMTVTPSDWIQN
jgi:type II secretory pathway component PulK